MLKYRSVQTFNRILAVASIFLGLSVLQADIVMAERNPAPDHAEVIMIGDRLVDVAYNLGVLPKAMAVRATFWPLTETFRGGLRDPGLP